MTLEEAYLVLVRGAWYVGGGTLDREVVVDCALVDGCRGLWDQFCAPHVLERCDKYLALTTLGQRRTEFHLAVLSIVIFAPCFVPESPGFLNDGERLTYLETAPERCKFVVSA